MQVNATLIAAQQAAREARARLAMPQASEQTAFGSQLDKAQGFSALPLKQIGPSPAPAAGARPAPTSAPSRVGQYIDITV